MISDHDINNNRSKRTRQRVSADSFIIHNTRPSRHRDHNAYCPTNRPTQSPETITYIPFKMCKQAKVGYTDCAHVYSDRDVELCSKARDPGIDAPCDNVEIYWVNLKFPGKCRWCYQQEKEKGWIVSSSGARSQPRPDWLK